MSGASILCKSHLADVGIALLQVKNLRGLTTEELGAEIGVTREMASQYIAGEAEMGFLKWLRANQQFPELAELIEETAAERTFRLRQHALDLDEPTPRQRRRAGKG